MQFNIGDTVTVIKASLEFESRDRANLGKTGTIIEILKYRPLYLYRVKFDKPDERLYDDYEADQLELIDSPIIRKIY